MGIQLLGRIEGNSHFLGLMSAALLAHRAFRPFTHARQPAAARVRGGSGQCASRAPLQRRLVAVKAQASAAPAATTAKEAVERGLEEFAAGRTEAALQLFVQAQQLRPNADEARAAYYNAACAQAKLRQWQVSVGCCR